MAKQPTKRELTHAKILEAASKSFKIYGYNGIGVDGIAKEAGVTSGAFYAHLGSKEKAFKEILISNFEQTLLTIPGYQQEHGENWILAFTAYYLGEEHRKDRAYGCWMTALTPELTNAPSNLQELYEAQITEVIAVIAQGLGDGDKGDREKRAWAMLSTLIGGLNIARAVKNEATANQIAQSASKAAIAAAGKTVTVS